MLVLEKFKYFKKIESIKEQFNNYIKDYEADLKEIDDARNLYIIAYAKEFKYVQQKLESEQRTKELKRIDDGFLVYLNGVYEAKNSLELNHIRELKYIEDLKKYEDLNYSNIVSKIELDQKNDLDVLDDVLKS